MRSIRSSRRGDWLAESGKVVKTTRITIETENLLVVRGHQPLAQAYAVHVMDVFEHYRFRHEIQTKGTGAFSGLEATDAWQDKFFDAGHPASRDANVWFPD